MQNKILKKVIAVLRKIVLDYDIKHGHLKEEPKLICKHFDTRNQWKADTYKIPADKPQCPIFNDNRCCGGCSMSATCDHCAYCNCFGYEYTARGGNDESVYMRKCLDYYYDGRLDKNGKFDWDYYKTNQAKRRFKANKFVIVVHDGRKYVAEIKSGLRFDNSFRCYIPEINYFKRTSFSELTNHYAFYPSYDQAQQFCYNFDL